MWKKRKFTNKSPNYWLNMLVENLKVICEILNISSKFLDIITISLFKMRGCFNNGDILKKRTQRKKMNSSYFGTKKTFNENNI